MIPDLGPGGGGKYGLDVDALGPKFLGKPLRQEEHESLRRAVNRHGELRREADDRADIDDRALTSLGKTRSNGAGKPHKCGGIEGDKLAHVVKALLDEGSTDRRSGIVDEYADARIVTQPGFNLCKIRRLGEIGLEDIDRYAGLLAQTARKRFHSNHVSGDQQEIMSASSEPFGIGGANARGGAGN